MPPGSRALGAAVALVAAAGVACAGRAPRPAAAELAITAELLAAVDVQHLDSALLARALAGTATTRRLAVQAAGQSRSRHLARTVRALASDPDSGVAARATFAAGLLADTGAVSALSSALSRPTAVAREAAWSLGEIGEPARGAIVAALGASVGQADTVTAELLVAASKLRPVPIPAVAPHAASPSAAVREAVAYAVGRPRVPGGVRLLLDLAADASADTRSSVARGLARSAAGDSLAIPARSALDRLARDPVPAVRVAALRSLGTYPEMRATVTAALHDPDANVRVAAAEAVAPLVGRDDAAWQRLWEADTGFAVRRARLGAVAPRPAALLGRAAEWARDPDWRRRAAAAPALLATGGDPRALAALLRDPDARARAAAYGALGDALDSTVAQPDLRAALLRGLTDADAIVRATAIGALGTRPSSAEAPAVRAAYDRAAADRDNDARLAALRYLARLWEASGSRSSADGRARLFELPTPRDPLELAAAAGLPGIRGAAPMATPRPASYYRSVASQLLLPALRGAPAPRVRVRTVRGDLTLALHAADAPLTVRNFLELVERGFYAGTRFHRVVPGFVAQDGDPRGDGNGGPGYAVRDEHNRRRYQRGAVGMALSGPNTGGSQYFVTLTRQPHLDGHYTVFGQLVEGGGSLDRLVQGDSILAVRVVP